MPGDTIPVPVRTLDGEFETQRQDLLAVEEPLEIRINGQSVAVTMRTPGNDVELAAGFLFSEGILSRPGQVERLDAPGGREPNLVDVILRPGESYDAERLRRSFFLSSSCGVCGKASLAALESACSRLPAEGFRIAPAVLHGMPSTLREAQAVFSRTGGLHAAGLFDASGNLESLREDVGRHNAVDKLIGAAFLAGRTPLGERMMLVSGRASFELAQKAVLAGIPLLAAVGAPSSLAVATALRFHLTLVGFLRAGRCNVYSAPERLLRGAGIGQ